MEKETWKDDVLNSLAGITKAEPNTFLFTRIETRLEQTTMLSKWQLSLAAACMVLMVAINLWVAASQNTPASQNNSLTTIYRY